MRTLKPKKTKKPKKIKTFLKALGFFQPWSKLTNGCAYESVFVF